MSTAATDYPDGLMTFRDEFLYMGKYLQSETTWLC